MSISHFSRAFAISDLWIAKDNAYISGKLSLTSRYQRLCIKDPSASVILIGEVTHVKCPRHRILCKDGTPSPSTLRE